MIRRGLSRVGALLLAAALVGVLALSPSASAQNPECTYNNLNACKLDGPTRANTAPENVESTEASAAFTQKDAVPEAGAAASTGAGAAASDVEAPKLAFTGAETGVIAWIGSALIATGAIALVAQRRIDD